MPSTEGDPPVAEGAQRQPEEDDFTHYFNATRRLGSEVTSLRRKLVEVRRERDEYRSQYQQALDVLAQEGTAQRAAAERDEAREGKASIIATLKGWQEGWDDGRMSDAELAAAVMGLDVDEEGAPGEIRSLRASEAQLHWRVLEAERKVDMLAEALRELDLSDAFTLTDAHAGELVACTRPVEAWQKLVRALASLKDGA